MRDELSLHPTTAVGTVEAVNARQWSSAGAARRAARTRLRAVELALLARHRDALRGDVLELCPAGGALTAALALGARTLTGLGPSRPAAELCRTQHPAERFLERRLDGLDCFADGSFDVVVAGRRALDMLGDARRRGVLDQLHRVLAYDGALILSSHNLGSESLVLAPSRNLTWNPVRALGRIARMPQALRNRANLGPLQQREHGFAVLNPPDNSYATLQYYIARDAQARQFREHGFELLECLTLDGSVVGPGETAYGCHELYYAARRIY